MHCSQPHADNKESITGILTRSPVIFAPLPVCLEQLWKEWAGAHNRSRVLGNQDQEAREEPCFFPAHIRGHIWPRCGLATSQIPFPSHVNASNVYDNDRVFPRAHRRGRFPKRGRGTSFS